MSVLAIPFCIHSAGRLDDRASITAAIDFYFTSEGNRHLNPEKGMP